MKTIVKNIIDILRTKIFIDEIRKQNRRDLNARISTLTTLVTVPGFKMRFCG